MNGNSTSAAGVNEFTRNNYFYGKLLTVEDMDVEQSYHTGIQRTLNRFVSGWGGVCGLDVGASPDLTGNGDAGELVVTVSEGLALDRCGRLIAVEDEQHLRVPLPVTDDADAPTDTVSVYVEYDECYADPVPAAKMESACEQECEDNHVVQGAEVTYEAGAPDDFHKSVAEVEFPDAGELGLTGQTLAIRGAVRANAWEHEDVESDRGLEEEGSERTAEGPAMIEEPDHVWGWMDLALATDAPEDTIVVDLRRPASGDTDTVVGGVRVPPDSFVGPDGFTLPEGAFDVTGRLGSGESRVPVGGSLDAEVDGATVTFTGTLESPALAGESTEEIDVEFTVDVGGDDIVIGGTADGDDTQVEVQGDLSVGDHDGGSLLEGEIHARRETEEDGELAVAEWLLATEDAGWVDDTGEWLTGILVDEPAAAGDDGAVDVDAVLAGLARSYYENEPRTECGDVDRGRVLVGTVTRTADDWTATDGDGELLHRFERGPLLYTNDMLFDVLARHVSDFDNPHEVSLGVDGGNGGEVDARVGIEESDGPTGTIGLTSTDDSVSITPNRIQGRVDLSIEAMLEERLEPLERYAMEKALKYTALIFERAAERFDDEAAESAGEIAVLSRGAVDGRLADGTSAEAAEERDVLHRDWSVDATLSGDVFRKLLDQLESMEGEFATAVASSVTDDSKKRLDLAMERLHSTLDRDAGTLALASAQDDVVDAVEWLELAEESDASFSRSTYSAHRGDLVEMTVALGDADTATLEIGSDASGYHSTVTLEDGNADGTVSVLMNTYLAGRFEGGESRAFGTVADADGVSAQLDTAENDDILEPGDYDLRLLVDGNETDVAALILEERSTDSLTVQRAPDGAIAGLNSPEDVLEARDADLVTTGNEVAAGDTVVLDVGVTGIFGAAAAVSGSSTSLDPGWLLRLIERHTIDLEVVQTRVEDRAPKRLDIAESLEEGSAKFVPFEDDGHLLLIVDSGEANFRRGTQDEILSANAGETYTVEFAVSPNSNIAVPGEGPVSAEFFLMEPAGTFDTGESGVVTVTNSSDVTVTGTANIAPGTEVTVRASGEDEPFLQASTTTVDVDGTFAAEFDFSDVAVDTQFTASLRHDSAELAAAPGQVVASSG